MSVSNFWPENLDEGVAEAYSPEDSLGLAAKQLDALTGGKVVGEVQTRGVGDKLEHSFYLRATEVDYRYFMFKVRHTIDGFPIELIYSNQLEAKEFLTRDTFEAELLRLFGAPQTRRLVSRLRNLVREVG